MAVIAIDGQNIANIGHLADSRLGRSAKNEGCPLTL
jgi:hypothetical protein